MQQAERQPTKPAGWRAGWVGQAGHAAQCGQCHSRLECPPELCESPAVLGPSMSQTRRDHPRGAEQAHPGGIRHVNKAQEDFQHPLALAASLAGCAQATDIALFAAAAPGNSVWINKAEGARRWQQAQDGGGCGEKACRAWLLRHCQGTSPAFVSFQAT